VEDLDNKPKLVALLKDIMPAISPYNHDCKHPAAIYYYYYFAGVLNVCCLLGLQFVFSLLLRFNLDPAAQKELKKSSLILDIIHSFRRVIPPTLEELVLAKKLCMWCLYPPSVFRSMS